MTKHINVIGDQTVASNRILNPENSGMSLVYWQQQRPIVPAELNFMQQLGNEQRRILANSVARQGFFTRDAFTTNSYNLVVPDSWALVNGETLHVVTGLGTNASAYAGTQVTLSAAPGGGTAYDVVFLEMWYAEVAALGTGDAASKEVLANGRSGGTDLASDGSYVLKDPLVTAVPETTRRIQTRWRIRVFNSVPAPVGDGMVASGGYTTGPGAMADSGANQATYPYAALTGIYAGLYRAGDGSLTASQLFKDTTGYVYAIPICIVTHTAGEGVLQLNQVSDKRNAANILSRVSISGNNLGLAGDDIIFYLADGTTETARLIGSSGLYRFQTKQFVSTVPTGDAPFLVSSTTKVTNLNAHYLDVGGTATPAGNLSGNIPVSNGTVNTNLNAAMLDGRVPGKNPGNVVYIENSGPNSGYIDPALLNLSTPTTVTYLSEARLGFQGSGPSGAHPSSDFLLKSEASLMGVNGSGVPAAANAAYAINAGSATTAGAATRVNLGDQVTTGVIGAGTSISKNASSANVGNTVVLRDNNGNFTAGTITAGNFNGVADTANTLTANAGTFEPLNFSTGFLIKLSEADQWTVQGLGSYTPGANNWVEPTNKLLVVPFAKLFHVPIKPSRIHVKDAGIPVRGRLYGVVYRQAIDNPIATATYGFRLLSPTGVAKYQQTFTMGPGGSISPGQMYTRNLEDFGPAYFTVATDGSDDGWWKIQISTTDAGANNYGVGQIYLELYAFGPNGVGS